MKSVFFWCLRQPVEQTEPIVVDEHPVAADVKKADAEIITALYEKYFA